MQVLSREHHEIYKNTYFEENLRTAASGRMRRELNFQISTEAAIGGVL